LISSPSGSLDRHLLDVNGMTRRPGTIWVHLASIARRSAVAVLLGFHVQLFLRHLHDGRLLDPETAFRWVAGFVLAAGLLAVWRAGLGVVSSRQAAVVWVLVALLHASATLPSERASEPLAPSQGLGLFFVLPTATAGMAVAGWYWLRRSKRPKNLQAALWHLRSFWRISAAHSPHPLAGVLRGIG